MKFAALQPLFAALLALGTPALGLVSTDVPVRGQVAKFDDDFAYGETEATKFGNFAGISYCSKTAILAWNCMSCQSLQPSFRPTLYDTDPVEGTAGYIGYEDSSRRIYMVFRGTVDVPGWFTNLQFLKTDYDMPGMPGARVHSGWYQAARKMWDSTMKAEMQRLVAQKPGYTIAVSGHSLGGAMAVLMSTFARESFPSANIVAYTYGAPRVGNEVFAQYWETSVSPNTNYRLTNRRDPVPQMPFRSMGFHHSRTEVYYRDGAYTVCDATGEDPNCSNSVKVPTNFNDHSNYVGLNTQC